jgi:amidohydrolase
MMLAPSDLADLIRLRQWLHRNPEVSGQESATALQIAATLEGLAPDQIITGLGGHGVAAVFAGAAPGPTVLLRAELDALPINELTDLPHASAHPGRGHLCGHDGHMACLMGVARALSRDRPKTGRVILLFQPAEEDGSGAAAVLADARFAALQPDWAFAFHNYPGVPLGQALLAPGPVNCASLGLRIALTGKTAHASQPEAGLSPAPAMAAMIPALAALGQGGALTPAYRLVTLTHARLGAPAFGIAPAEGELWATLRTLTDDAMSDLLTSAETLARTTAQAHGLTCDVTLHDRFEACVNDAAATACLERALVANNISFAPGDLPMRASEDFGRFGASARAAMVFLGAGADHPRLHNPDYDFPDVLIAPGASVLWHAARQITG